VATDSFMVVSVNAKDLLNLEFVKEMKTRKFPVDGKEMGWTELEQMAQGQFGVKPSDIDMVTLCMPDVPDRGPPGMVVIVTSNAEFNKDAISKQLGKGPPSKRSGFISLEPGMFLHFPDPKIAVMISEQYIDRYLNGYAKDRSQWPMNEAIQKASRGHLAMMAMNVSKVPERMKNDAPVEGVRILNADSALLVLDVRGDEIVIGARGTYGSTGAAADAAADMKSLKEQALRMIDQALQAPDMKNNPPVIAKAAQEFRNAFAASNIEASGKDVTAAVTYKMTFSVGEMLTQATMKVRDAATRTSNMNNLKQIGLAMYSYNDSMGLLPIHGVGKNGNPRLMQTEKPLLSWRVAILAYIDEDALYRQFKLDEPWDSENNKKLIDKMPKIFAARSGDTLPPGQTRLQMLVGPSLMRPFMTIQGIADGSSNTLAVVESANPVIWTKPEDIVVAGDKMPANVKAKFYKSPTGFLAVMFDGSVRQIRPEDYTEAELWGLMTPGGGEVVRIK